MHHVHESPWVMLVPLIVLAVGAVFAGWLVLRRLRRRAHGSVLGRLDPVRRTGNEVPHHAHEVPLWVKLAPLVVGIAGIALAYLFYIVQDRHAGQAGRRVRAGCTASCSTSGTSTSSIDRLFVRPANTLGYGLWKGGDGAIIDGARARRHRRASRRTSRRQASRLQTGYVYHYAFAMLIGVVHAGHLVPVRQRLW